MKKNQFSDKEAKYNYKAINLLHSSRSGILSTISKKNKNYPFGSFATFVTARDRTIYFYFSDIAQHTINLKENPKACLTISKSISNEDVQNSQRLSLMGNIKSIKESNKEYCKNKFHEFFPESKKYMNFHGFNFYQLEINSIRWIGGFGKIAWLETEDWKSKDPKWKKHEESIINHMNSDHSNSIVSSLNAQHNIKDHKAKMIFLTKDGYYVKSKKEMLFIQLEQKCNTMQEYKEELINLAKKYRSFELVNSN